MKRMTHVNQIYFILVDAFVAMGGNADKSGTVDATKLIQVCIIIIQIIKSDFKMTIDIEVKMHKYLLRD